MAPVADVVHGLEETDVEGQVTLGDTPVRAEPRAKEAPDALDGVDVNLVNPVTIGIAGKLSLSMVDGDMGVAPLGQASVDAVFVGVDATATLDHLCDQGLDRALLDVVTHLKEDLATPRDHA